MYDRTIQVAFDDVKDYYRNVLSSTIAEESLYEIDLMVTQLDDWFNSSQRIASQNATDCVNVFLLAELEAKHAPGSLDRLLVTGRPTTLLPTLGERHHELLSQAAQPKKDALTECVATHILCGYLFYEFTGELMSGSTLPRDRFWPDNETFYTEWLRVTYRSSFILDVDASIQQQDAGFLNVRGNWEAATQRRLHAFFHADSVQLEDLDRQIFFQYFNAGRTLRLLESK